MKNMTVTVPTDTYYRARIWAAKHMTSVSSIVGKMLRQMAEQTPRRHPSQKFLKMAVKLWTPVQSTTCGHSFTVSQFSQPLEPASPADIPP